MVRVIIAGSRKFNDQDLFDNTIHDILLNYDTEELEIISGCCTGADAMGEEYARSWDIKLAEFPAYWNKYGKAAGPMRNEQMARYASESDHGILIAFPIGESRGTRNMIKLAKQYGLEVHVIDDNGKFSSTKN